MTLPFLATKICNPGVILLSIALFAKASIWATNLGFIPTFSGTVKPNLFNFSVLKPSLTLKLSPIETGNLPLASIAPKSN